MEGTVEAMAAAYDALVDAAAAVVRDPTSRAALTHLNICRHDFAVYCDRADDLIQAATAHAAVAAAAGAFVPSPPDTSRLDALCRAVCPIVQDLQASPEQEPPQDK